MRPCSRRALILGNSSFLPCRSCHLWSRNRGFASASVPQASHRPPSSGLAKLGSRRLLELAGPDASKFLQGIVTANVAAASGLPRTDGFYAGFLNATGRVLHDVFIYPIRGGWAGGHSEDGSGFLIEVDTTQLTRLEKYIKRYKLRAKVTVRSLSDDEASVWQAWDDTTNNSLNLEANESRLILKDTRSPDLGYRLIQLNNKAPQVDLTQGNEDVYTVRRYLQGVAEGQDEILREHALPLECNMEFMSGIDFHKGCYVGQELTIRTKHRGVVRKRILPCMIYEADRAAPQQLQYIPDSSNGSSSSSDDTLHGVTLAQSIPTETSIGRSGKRGRSAGKWLKGVGNIGLGLCRLEIMTDVVLPGEQAAATFKPDDEFVLEWGEEDNRNSAKVKAFVPQWLRKGLNGA